MNKKYALLCVFFLIITGCMPLTHQNAAPVAKPGHFELTGGLNFLKGDGSAAAFNIGARVGVAPRVDIGFTEDALSNNLDFKFHIVTDEMAKFDFSASLGAGVSILMAYKYWNVIFSKNMGDWNPYFAFRNVYVDDDKTDPGDEGDGAESVVWHILTAGVRDLNQFFIGTEYKMSEKTYFVIEAMYLPAEGTANLLCVNAGFKFKF